jgi:uncharacterized protein (PEP-CTERM system associated)
MPRPVNSRQRPPVNRPGRLSLLAACVLGCAQSVSAQTPTAAAGVQAEGAASAASFEAPGRTVRGWATEASIAGQATLTNNANFGDTGNREADLILEATPALSFSRRGARLRVDGAVALRLLGYVNDTQTSSILPRADVTANFEAIENLFFIDGSLFVDQGIENPFLPGGPGFSSTNNLYTTTQARLAPYLQGNIGSNVNWLIRSEHSYTWTSQSDNDLGNAYYVRNLAQIVRNPTPVGLTVRLTNDVTRFKNQASAQPDQTLDTALAILDYAVTPQLTLGLRGGYERTNYTFEETSGPIYGASIAWRPSPITSLVGFWEERFYGPSYDVQFSHRQRRLASTLTFYRTITTYPQVLFQIPATNNVSGLLDAILVARFPDPVERAGQVQDLITRQGLPPTLPGGANIFNQSINILTGGQANWALIGVRNTLALNVFYLKTELLPDAAVPPTFLRFNNSIQQGGALTLSHRMSPVMNLSGTVSTQTTRGFDANADLDTRENLASLQVNWQASPRSTLFVGTRYRVQTTNSVELRATESSETAIFAGLFHRL